MFNAFPGSLVWYSMHFCCVVGYRYMYRRARGLIVKLKESKQTALQKLLTEIDTKSVSDIDTENKLHLK